MRWIRCVVASMAIAGAMLLAGASVVRADNDACQRRTIKADHKLHQAVDKHGWTSPQAEHWRHELSDARAYCWEHGHRWWDEDGHRWHTERDWDDHDHDHDRDHDHDHH
ncbi:MAG: hypothetical protein WCE53_10890 [Candidatus Acidiferrum sp.]